MTIQRYSIGINVEKDDEADFCFYSDFIESLAEKESHLMLRNAIITHLEMVITERNGQIAVLTVERDELKAIFKEQEAIICGVGPITCRNGVVHERDDDSDCLYCQMDRIKTKNKRLTAELKMKISDWMEVCKKNDALTDENKVLREQNTMMAESKKRLREAMGDVEGGLIRLSNDTQDILSDIMGTNQDSAEEEEALQGGE